MQPKIPLIFYFIPGEYGSKIVHGLLHSKLDISF